MQENQPLPMTGQVQLRSDDHINKRLDFDYQNCLLMQGRQIQDFGSIFDGSRRYADTANKWDVKARIMKKYTHVHNAMYSGNHDLMPHLGVSNQLPKHNRMTQCVN
ncbi:hypothetical protein EVAR_97948_1 [Eumeta japonica]|uniref:Uncharacterized protein n=1 Tax=Eumeta variegata TaxID=151549 RepID=A0A4C1XUV6_EUMVA|nr:hypothetical protein EVAR_97948_1 [Eumeta japonica]